MSVNGAYRYNIDEKFAVEPSFLLKYERPAPLKVDVGARAIYQDQVWVGIVYRHHDAISTLLGYCYKDYLLIGYSYDFTTTRLRSYNGGTHEIMFGLRFSRKQAPTWEKAGE